MEELVQSQIKDYCKLNIPAGLSELMSDISREVLRAQPQNIYKFITDYLSSLLVTRHNLSITARVCNELCNSEYQDDLLTQLKGLGLNDNDVEIAHQVIVKYLSRDNVNEGNLMTVLMKKTNIEPTIFPNVLNVVRAAYLRRQALDATKYLTRSVNDNDDVDSAVAHTINMYKQTIPDENTYTTLAEKLKASYLGHTVRRDLELKNKEETPESAEKSSELMDEMEIISDQSSISETLMGELLVRANSYRNRMETVSSLSLAGSLCGLPQRKPYNVNDIDSLQELEETEKEHTQIDYTSRCLHLSFAERKKEETRDNDEEMIENQRENDMDDDESIENNEGDVEFDGKFNEANVDHVLGIDDQNDNESVKIVEEFLIEESEQGSMTSVPEEILGSDEVNMIMTDYEVTNDDYENIFDN